MDRNMMSRAVGVGALAIALAGGGSAHAATLTVIPVTGPLPGGTTITPISPWNPFTDDSVSIPLDLLLDTFANVTNMTFTDLEITTYTVNQSPFTIDGGGFFNNGACTTQVCTSVHVYAPPGGGIKPGTAFKFSLTDLALKDNGRPYQVTITPSVPEPGVWALMLLGFGLVGGALRRQGRTAAPTVCDRVGVN